MSRSGRRDAKHGLRAQGGRRPPAGRRTEPKEASRGHGRGRLVLWAGVIIAAGVLIALWIGSHGRPEGRNAGPEGDDRAPGPSGTSVTAKEDDRFPDGELRRRSEFLRVAERLYRSDDGFFGGFFRRGRAEEIRRARASAPLQARLELTFQLVHQLLKDGEAREAVDEVEQMFALLRRTAPQVLEQSENFHRLRGLAYLRLAEVENCVKRHNAECCLFPLRGGGVHDVKHPAQEAVASYLAYLELKPDDLGMRWLLNVAAMAAGIHPGGLPMQNVIPPAAFESSATVSRFVDVAGELGLDTFNLCGGCIADDFDGDGHLDIVTSTIDPAGPLVHYVNNADGTFVDRSRESHLDDQLGGLNIVGGDYDGDGDVDVLVLRGAWLFDDGCIRNSLLRNNGDGTFTDVTFEAGLAEPPMPTQAAAWGDFDNDGDLDLFVGNESRAAWGEAEGDYPSQLFRNDGSGTFTDVAVDAGVTNDRYCKGVTAGDFDNDGDLDLYLSNIGPNRLYRNDGAGGDLRFADIAPFAGVTEPVDRSFATWFFDYDNDGLLDLFVAAYEAEIADVAAQYLGRPNGAAMPRLYRNDGAGGFEDVTRAAGLDRPFLPMGANFGDIDNDGFLDIYLTTGQPSYEAIMPNVMLLNDGGRRFLDASTAAGLGHLQKGHGVAFADFDHDGDQDLYHQLGGFYAGDAFHNALFMNPGNGHRFLTVRLVGTRSHASGYGARLTVTIETPQGTRRVHRAAGSVSSFGGSPARQEIGLGNASAIVSLEVVWPASGARQVFEGIPLDRFVEVVEGENELRLLELAPVAMPPGT